jgi:predicted permease
VGVIRDLLTVLRDLRRSPGFVVTAALTLALGVGANTAIFSIINGFLRPMGVPDPDQLVVVAASLPGDDTGLRFRFSFPAIEDYRRRASSFSDVFGYDLRVGGLNVDGKVMPLVYSAVTGNFFTGLGLTPAAGRLFAPGEGEHHGAEPVIVLGHGYWQRRFGASASAVGRIVRLDGAALRVIGVAPSGFSGMTQGTEMDAYVTFAGARRLDGRDIFTDRAARRWTMAARMKPGVSLEDAQAETDVVAAQIEREHPVVEQGTRARVIPEPLARPLPWPLLSTLLPSVRFYLFLLSSVVLVIACLNVANILLVRVTAREREMAVRASLGAGRWRLVRLLFTESLLLALSGTALGLLVGKVLAVMFVNSVNIGTDIPFRLDADFDWQVFGYSAFAAILTGVIVGGLPARRAARANVTSLLHDGGRSGTASRGRRRVRQSLVVAQVAGSLLLLIVAGLFVRNLQAAQGVDLGFRADGIVTARLDTMNLGFDTARSVAFYDELERRLRELPGVESASLSFNLPLGWILGGYLARPEGWRESDGPEPSIGTNTVTPGFFDTIGIPIARGRGFNAQDTSTSTRVTVINEVLADRFWPGQDAIGRRILIPGIPGPPWEVVGIARMAKYMAVFESPLPYIYLPQTQNPSFLRSVLVKTSVPLDEMRARVEREIHAIEPELPVADLKPFVDIVRGNIGFVLFRVGAWQATTMGVLGLALAIIGVYGVVSYQTRQREKEIGIRVALGAIPADVRRLVLSQGAWLVGAGAIVGVLLALIATLALRRMLVLVSVTDPLTFVGVTAALSASALAACYLPARRATRVEPVTVLRQE